MQMKEMTWCDNRNYSLAVDRISANIIVKVCPSCGHQGTKQDLLGLPAGVKFDPTDLELLEHLEGKVRGEAQKLRPFIDEFIPTLEGENGICYTHPEKLPGVSTNGLIRHFFHRPSKAYTTGTRKRRKVNTDAQGGETRWHKTGKTRPVLFDGKVKGHKKILVLYTNYGKRKKPEKTNWVMHQYHLGSDEEEKDGELVVSKVFYQTQPRQCASGSMKGSDDLDQTHVVDDSGYYRSSSSNSTMEYSNQLPRFTVNAGAGRAFSGDDEEEEEEVMISGTHGIM